MWFARSHAVCSVCCVFSLRVSGRVCSEQSAVRRWCFAAAYLTRRLAMSSTMTTAAVGEGDEVEKKGETWRASWQPRPPAHVRGMPELQRDKFTCYWPVHVALVRVDAHFSRVLAALKPRLLRVRQCRPVRKLHELEEVISAEEYRHLLEQQGWQAEDTVVFIIPPEPTDKHCLSSSSSSSSTLSSNGHSHSSPNSQRVDECRPARAVCDHVTVTAQPHDVCVRLQVQLVRVRMTYVNFSQQAVLAAVLPADQPPPTGFSQIGHVVHVNLRASLLPHGQLIGHVLLDKVHGCRTVVNKIDCIDSQFRNMQLQLLAGQQDYVVSVRENGRPYRLDFSQVYWNPRLSTEHERLVQCWLQRDHTVFEVFAGVGPFAVPAAARGCIVLANDLNPASHRWLVENVALNHVQHRVRTFNMCGRRFIEQVVREHLLQHVATSGGGESQLNCHLVMNLPASAVLFLDCLLGLLNDRAVPTFPTSSSNLSAGASSSSASSSPPSSFQSSSSALPPSSSIPPPSSSSPPPSSSISSFSSPPSSSPVVVSGINLLAHVYTFTKDQLDPETNAVDQISSVIGQDISPHVKSTHFVRNVAPNKNMYCVTWRVPDHLLLSTGDHVRAVKKAKI